MGFVNSVVNESANSVITANEAYTVEDAWMVAQEAADEWHSVFEAVAGMDYYEAKQKYGAVTESAVQAVNEAGVKGILDRVLAAIKAFGEKVKGIIMNLIHKFQALFTTDGKKLVKDHEKAINEKMNKQLMNKFKFKYGTFTAPNKEVMSTLLSSKLGSNLNNEIDNMNMYDNTKGAGRDVQDSTLKGDAYKVISSDDITSYKEDFFTSLAGVSTDEKSFKKDLIEKCLPDSEEKEGLDRSTLSAIISTLNGHKGIIDQLNKDEKAANNDVNNKKKSIEAMQKKMNNLASSKDYDGANKATAAKAARAMQLITACSAVIGTAFTGIAEAYKADYKQCRAIWIKAVGYNGKTESTVLESAIVETSDFDVDMMFA